jgi:hypothetical protein
MTGGIVKVASIKANRQSVVPLFAVLALALAVVGCGGGGGPAPSPTPSNPVPRITALSPASTTAGGSAFTLTVTGSNFLSSSKVRWNGADRTTTFGRSTQLSAEISASDISTGATAQVTVFNPAPGGGTSNALPFTVNNPAPGASSLSPSSGVAGGPAFTLTVNGSNFVSTSVVRWNGADRTTTFVNNAKLQAAIPASDVASTGTAQVTVFNPTPGGGTSNNLTFSIGTLVPIAITTTRLPDTAAGKNYDYILASNGGAPPIQWSVTAGAVPLDLTLDLTTGRISGTVNPAAAGSTATFTVQATDSAMTPQTATQTLSIVVRAGVLGSNDTCTPASTTGTTAISNGRIRSSISPYGDVDVYSFSGTAGAQVTIEIFAQRLDLDGNPATRDSQLDAVTELLDNNCSLITFSDDIDPGVIQDSLILIDSTATPPTPTSLPYTGTYYIRVRDFRGDGRPDLIYELALSGAD